MPNALIARRAQLTVFVVLVGLVGLTFEDEIRCFCDRLTCPGSLMCTGKWCLIGISTEGGNGRLDQVCGWDDRDRPLDCAKNWDRWTEVCACDQPLCNTFAHLRSNIDRLFSPQEDSMYESSNKKLPPGVSPSRVRGWYQGANLVILLVILPLIVGGLAVCLVFVNYHCKMN